MVARIQVTTVAPECVARDLIKRRIHAIRLALRTIPPPRLDRHIILIRSQQRQPVRTRCHPKRTVFQSVGAELQLVCESTLPHKHMRLPLMRLRYDLQLRTADLLHVSLQLLRRQLRHARRLLGDDDFSARLVVLDEEGLRTGRCGEEKAEGKADHVTQTGVTTDSRSRDGVLWTAAACCRFREASLLAFEWPRTRFR